MPFLPLDGPSLQLTVSVGTVTIVEVKVGASVLNERKVITVQPMTQKIYLYFAQEGITPSAATVAADGFVIFKNAKETYECGDNQKVYLLSSSGTTNVKICERA